MPESPLAPVVSLVPGIKADTGKARWDAVPFDALASVVAALTHGAAKYDERPGSENWARLEGGEHRYFAACMRHLTAWRLGERTDAESGLPHLAHAGACLLFLLGSELRGPR